MADNDLIVVVPGITGSALRAPNREIWNLSAAAVAHGLAHVTDTLTRMRLPEGIGDNPPDPPHALAATGLIQGIHLWPGFWVGSGYGQLLRVLRGRCGERVVAFAYDWRLSNRYTAYQLQHAATAALEQWQQQPGQADAKVTFVCHSMGGLIARYYLDVLGGANITRRLITIGTPYSGSVKAIKALAGGLIPRISFLDAALTEVARTFPSIHQLLPSYHCINVPGHDPAKLAGHSLPDLPLAAVADGSAFHDEIRSARDRASRYEEYFFAGKNQPTDQSVTPTPRGLDYQRTQRGMDHKGDGTVPHFSSIPTHADSTAAGIYCAARHSKLQTHKQLLDLVTDKVNALDQGAILAPEHELGLDLPDVVVAGDAVLITVTADRSDLFLQATITAPNGTVHDHHVPLRPHGDSTYTTLLQPPPGIWHIDIQTVNDPVPAQISDILIVHQQT